MNSLFIAILNAGGLSILYCIGTALWHIVEYVRHRYRYKASLGKIITRYAILALAIIGTFALLMYFGLAEVETVHFFVYSVITQIIALVITMFLAYLIAEINYKDKYYKAKYKEHKDDLELGLLVFVAFGSCLILGIFAACDLGNTTNAANSVPIQRTVHKANTMPLPDNDNNAKIEPVVNSQQTVNDQVNMSLSKMQNEHANLNSYKIDTTQVQLYHGKLVYVISLDYAKHFSKFRGWDTIPGYFIMDATHKEAKPHFVKKTMYYANSGYFAQNVDRKFNFLAVKNNIVILDSPTYLEIAEDGTPYYVKTGYHFISGFKLPRFNNYKVLTVNAVNGQTTCYDQSDAPKWLDNVVSPDLLEYAVRQYAEYRNGFNNREMPWGSRSGVNYLAHNVGYLEVDKDDYSDNNSFTPVLYKGKMYYFGTLTSLNNSQNSVTGYVYADPQIGKITISSETANAMTSRRAERLAVNKLRQTKWRPSMPLLYLIDHKLTWVVSMVDNDGVFQQYVYIKADGNGLNNTIAIGDNADEALLNYRTLFAGEATTAKNEHSVKITKTGTVDRVNRYNENNVRFTLKNQRIVYNVSIKRDADSIFLEPNDKIKVTGFLSDNTVIVTKITRLTK